MAITKSFSHQQSRAKSLGDCHVSFSPISMVVNVWCLPTFLLANLPQILNEIIEHDLIIRGITKRILRLFSIYMNTKNESPKIYC
jgi:hypothetical protein